MRRLGWDLRSFSSNSPLGCTYIIWHNESMDDTIIKAPKTSGKKKTCQFQTLNSSNCGGSCQGQIQIPLNPRQDLSVLKCNLIQGLDLNSTTTPPSHATLSSKSIRGSRTSNESKHSSSRSYIFHCCLVRGKTGGMTSSIHKKVACPVSVLVCFSSLLSQPPGWSNWVVFRLTWT